jgi:hypothetical protein
MRTLCRAEGPRTLFILTGVDPAYHEAVRHLGYGQEGAEFVKAFPTATPHLARIYANFAAAAPALVAQQAGSTPLPWQAALHAALDRVAPLGGEVFLVGSAALAVRGLAVQPGDIDFVVDDATAQRLTPALLDTLIEPIAPVEGWICTWFGRCWMPGLVEWAGGVLPVADAPEPSDYGPLALARAETIPWQGHMIRVPPLDLQLAVTRRRGRSERAALIAEALQID